MTSITQSSTRLVAMIAGVAVALSLFAGAFAAAPAQAAALSQSQINAIVSLLQSFGADAQTVANVTASLNGQATSGTGTTTGGGACPALSRSLQQGSTGADVKALQVFLNGKAATQVAVSGAGSPGLESTYFGPATKAAVTKFQTLNSVDAIGIVGPATRAAIAAVCGGTSTGGGGTTPSGPGLSVSASAQPANSLAVQSASRVPFTTFTLTNNSSAAVTVNSVTVQRTGFANDAVFSGIVLLDQTGAQIGVSSTLNSNHQANIGSSFTLNAGQSMTYTVAGNMAASLSAYSGQIAQLQVVAINSSAAVSGSLPITGASQTINSSLAIGTAVASISSFDPNNGSKHNIGDTGITFSGVRLQAGSAEDVRLSSIRWRMNGSVSASDLANLMTYVNGTSYPTSLSTDGRYLTSVFPGGILVQKGYSADVYLKGDISGSNATGRTAEFDIDKASDIYVVGQTYGYGIIPTGTNVQSSLLVDSGNGHATEFYSGQPFFQGSTVTIQGGTVTTITNATSVASQNVAINVPNQVLGGFTTNFIGEPVSVQNIVFDVSSTTSGGTGHLTSVSIVDSNGSVVAGPVDSGTDANGKLTFGNTITFPVGSATYTLKGTIPSTAANGDTYRLSTNPSSGAYWSNITGQTTGNAVSLSGAGLITMNTMTVRGATLSVSVSATPAVQSIVAGGQNVVFANVQLDASQSGENIRINSLPLYMTASNGTIATATTTLSGCALWNGTVGTGQPLNYGSNTVNAPIVAATSWAPSANPTSFLFNNSLVVAKGTVTTLTLTCNVASGTTGTFTWGEIAGATINATGNTSNSTVGPTNGTAGLTITSTSAGGQTVAGTGSLAVTADTATTPSYAIAAGGTNGVTMGVIKFRATNESINLTKVGLTLTTGLPASVGTVYLFNGSTQVGTVTFTGSSANAIATSTLTTAVNLPANTDLDLTIKADLAQIGTGLPGLDGAKVTIDASSAQGTGNSSGQPVNVGASTGVAGVTVYKTFPTVTLDNLTVGGITGDGQLIRFHVTANSAGSLGVQQFVFSLASSTGIVVTSPVLYAYSDSNYSVPAPGTASGGIAASGGAVTFTAPGNIATTTLTAPLQVSGGQSIYFLLKGTVTYNGAASNYSINTTLLGDTGTVSSMSTASALDLTSHFVWSPNATGTVSSLSANDYTTGAGVVGLPAIGINQNRTQ